MTQPSRTDSTSRSPDKPAVHLLVTTHTPRHIGPCVAGVAVQSALPASVAVSCDSDDPAIGESIRAAWDRIGESLGARGLAVPPLLWIARSHQGGARPNQSRNNGLRALDAAGLLTDRDQVVAIDGDMLLAPDAIARHRDLAASGHEVVIPFRINLTREVTNTLTLEALCEATGPDRVASLVDSRALADLSSRHRRYERHLALRRLPVRLVKAHKPKILGGHHAASVRVLRAINGYDEEYIGYAWEDDDLSRRLHGLKPPPRTAIAVRSILAHHLWHQTRATERARDADGYQRFSKRGLPMRAAHGWINPYQQPEPAVTVITHRASASI